MKRKLSVFSKVIISVFALLGLLLALTGVALNMGYVLYDTRIYLYLLLGMVIDLLVWAVWGITRRIKSDRKRMIVIFLLGFLVAMVATIAAEGINYIHIFSSRKYAEVKSDTGKELVIMRRYEFNQEKMNERYPEDGGEALARSFDDFDYYYSAFPKKMWFFVDANVENEGELIIGVDSQAKLMVEWPEENTARLYIEDAGKYDRGEMIIRFPQ